MYGIHPFLHPAMKMGCWWLGFYMEFYEEPGYPTWCDLCGSLTIVFVCRWWYFGICKTKRKLRNANLYRFSLYKKMFYRCMSSTFFIMLKTLLCWDIDLVVSERNFDQSQICPSWYDLCGIFTIVLFVDDHILGFGRLKGR